MVICSECSGRSVRDCFLRGEDFILLVRRVFLYLIDSQTDMITFLDGYNHSAIVAEFRGSEFIL